MAEEEDFYRLLKPLAEMPFCSITLKTLYRVLPRNYKPICCVILNISGFNIHWTC
jgi:hypothetical protein